MIKNSIEIDGFKLRYHIEGQGIPVLVIGSAIYYERTFSKALLEQCQMIYFDNRVFGGTCLKQPNQTDFELDKIYSDIELLRRHLNIDKLVIIGHSGHGYMALEYAKKYPEYVSHVIMVGIAPTHDEKSHAWAESNWQSLATEERKTALKNNLKKWPDAFVNNLPEPKNFVQNYIKNTPRIWFDYNFDAAALWDGVAFNCQGFNYIWGELFPKLDITQGLENFNIPTSVMVGIYDGLIAPPESWFAVKDKFKQLTISVFDKSAHTPQLEEPTLFNKRLLDFIKCTAD